ncbi:peptide chain release factor N(5)-glutamine methyltransferase [Ferruginibacter lapsinanis]|uniref:peptide chain release factor N(5)-glutamine methyltransferase n=1 Tax=Ferruginibacter lapsinanis TaxID=563172 RepID=UPI001E50BE09|nr:peptide chain release factor N(5)-glutamine methyltransferase [Ferruginibacter lapsinanis]UEG51250.1 peptide chain release factor N(5)-glutamine methyltransferase [Ferruginibacter lapsinanis]
MTTQELYKKLLNKLQIIYNLNEAATLTDWLFESIAGAKRADITLHPDKELEPAVTKRITNCLEELLQHKPIQYVLGEAWFYKMKFNVNEHVLIPRPETEELVQLITNDEIRITNNKSLRIVDIGTGSGCIAIALKKEIPGATVTAIDISDNALAVAKENALMNNTVVNFQQLNFIDENLWGDIPSFDIIVSNPPYIPVTEKEQLDKNVTGYEPHLALFVPDNTPLLFYEKIALFGKSHLHNNGKIFVETHENFAKETAAMFAQSYQQVEIIKDIFGKQRMVTATQSR